MMNTWRRQAAVSYGVPRRKLRLVFWCENDHDMVTWMACPDDNPCCWFCGQPGRR